MSSFSKKSWLGAVDDGDESFPLAPAAAVDAGTVNSVNSAAKPVATIAQLADYLINGFWQYNGTYAHHWGSATISYNISGLNANEQMLAQSALNAWHEVGNLTFVQTSGAANITFTHDGTMTAYEYDYYNGSGIISSAFVNISADWITNDGGAYDGRTGIDSYGYQTYIHEIGHALGLGHQGPYNGSATYSTDAIYADDTWQYSVMSYFPQNSYNGSYRYVVTPQMADIYAAQAIYGAATTRTGDTIYGFHNTAGSIFDFNNYTQAPALTIYDSSGNDTLDCSGYSTAQTINLHAGSFCSVGGLINNIGIALNAIIETAIGGSGNDTLIANDFGNRLYGGSGIDSLYGGSGNDSLTGGIGNDTIDGGSGTDAAVFAGLRSAYQVTILSSGAVQVSGADGVDMLVNVEALTFDDQTVTIAPNNPPATPTPHNQTMTSGTSVALSTLFTGLTDADAWDSVTQVWVSDRTAGNGHLTFNGVVQNDNQAFGPIPIGQLSQWAFLAGGTDTIAFQTV
ncbi:MAG: M10 family metallopeptidase, partial [Bradyrhizobium sp.]